MTTASLFLAVLLGADGLDESSRMALSRAAAAAERTAERMNKEGVEWTSTLIFEAGEVNLAIRQFPEILRCTLGVKAGERNPAAPWVVCRDDAWFVMENGRKRRYFPAEAPFPLPTFVLLMRLSALDFVDADAVKAVTAVETREDGALLARQALPEHTMANLRASLRNTERLGRTLKDAGRAPDPAVERQTRQINDMLARGLPFGIDARHGIVLERGLPSRRVLVRDFRWIGEKPDADLVIKDMEWEDRTAPIAADRREDLVQIGYNGIWQPGRKSGDSDLQLLDVKTGDFRRVPIPFGQALGGCFSRDRSRIYVTATVFEEASLQLFEVHLTTREIRPLGDGVLRQGIWMGPAISPDGKSLAAAQILRDGLKSQLHLIDIATGTATPLGPSLDVAYVHWRPDGKGLVARLREDVGFEKNDIRATLCLIDLEGNVTRLGPGDAPCVLPGSGRILFETNDRQWKTCDLEGKDIQAFGDGFKGFGFATAAPDGRRLMMMKFGGTNGPQPCVIDLQTFAVRPLTLPQGLWSRPCW